MTKPLIAAVHGAALAGGTGLAANCHIVVAADDATFGLTEIRIGLWPFVIFRTVVAALGQRRATELALSGRIFPAGEAREYGLVHHVVEGATLLDRAREIAAAIAEASPTAIQAGLAFVRDARGQKLGKKPAILPAACATTSFAAPIFRKVSGRFRRSVPRAGRRLAGKSYCNTYAIIVIRTGIAFHFARKIFFPLLARRPETILHLISAMYR